MKILYFWVTRVIQTTIPSILSNIFQEATRCYITKPEKDTGYWYTTVCASIHPLFATYCVLRYTMRNDRLNSSFTYTGMTVLVSVGLDWHKKIHSSLWSFPQKCSDQASCQGSWPQKHHRPWVNLELSIHICGQTLKNVHVSQPFMLQAI